ncbi:hypothetical protein M081_2672 [Bacteroides fragilis str. 3998 T(B) 4]|nr:hypothetical protein M081_2672 [Bacteroides fragilis str. 3998 T(B) 4]
MDSSAERLSSIQATALAISKYLHSPQFAGNPIARTSIEG